ncbi:MAG: CHC2 zinc finger domain-containing protein [Synechococcaceae cyanobacterium]|nr:CHC2 zinc finger domain-containing protein [Synechococcaceae cyanobacterium]
MTLSPSLLEAVRQRARIEDLFPAGALKRSGSGFLALCPWHNDRRPSLTVSTRLNRVKCFVCDRGEDPIGWLQDRQGLSFQEAVEELARRYGIPIPELDPQAAARAEAEQRERERLLALRQGQQQRFQRALAADLASDGPAAAFLRQRGLSAATAEAWGLGLNGQRLMLPIRDNQGRCCGFSGRSIGDEQPKYRNTTADVLFRKSELVFGLDQAADAIRRSGEALLVEGPLDVLQLHQGGFPQAVAAMGTALAPGQRQALQRAGLHRLVVAFDADEAGLKATGRLIAELRPMLIANQFELAVLALPEGRDPDDLLRAEGAEALRERLRRAAHWLTWELEQLLAPYRATPEDLFVLERCEIAGRKLLALLPAGALRQRVEDTFRKVMGEAPRAPLPDPDNSADANTMVPPPLRERAERRALRLYVAAPDCRAVIAGLPFETPLHRAALQALVGIQSRIPQGVSLEHDPLPAGVQALCRKLEPNLAALLKDLCVAGREVQGMLERDPAVELMAVMDVLEPVGESTKRIQVKKKD